MRVIVFAHFFLLLCLFLNQYLHPTMREKRFHIMNVTRAEEAVDFLLILDSAIMQE